MFEIVKVGHQKVLGEVIKITGNKVAIQTFESPSGLRVGDPVKSTGEVLCIELGPGLLDHIFDGIQRPLKTIHDKLDLLYIPKGISISSLDRDKEWDFQPHILKVGDEVTGGDIYGTVQETKLVHHKLMVPPNAMGRINYIAPPGNYHVNDVVLELEFGEKKTEYTMVQLWAVRKPRPVAERIPPTRPLFTQLRALDSLYPIAQGGTVTIPGAAGCGKNTILYFMSKCSNSDVVVQVGCGERSSEVTEVLLDFPEMVIKNGQENVRLMERTTLFANTSNMAISGRETSIFSGITVAEYYRDQGYNVSLLADSTSRWAEAVREISSRIGETPGDDGYPAYMQSRLASFYNRACRAVCLGGPEREGSVTILGTVSPVGGDFSEPFTAMTMSLANVFWKLDIQLARRKHFPSIDWLNSHSNYIELFEESGYNNAEPQYQDLRRKLMKIFQEEEMLKPSVMVMGKGELKEHQKITLEISALLREGFLQQNVFSLEDSFCPLWKTIWMMKNYVTYHELAQEALKSPFHDPPLDWKTIKSKTSELFNRLYLQKFQNPRNELESLAWFAQFNQDIVKAFDNL
uniref:H(+)-transporting two-sector ATPase n=1 Tax=Arcella intermedia TaxID=1963864 RepID=A0A6B2L0L8_9EUKA